MDISFFFKFEKGFRKVLIVFLFRKMLWFCGAQFHVAIFQKKKNTITTGVCYDKKKGKKSESRQPRNEKNTKGNSIRL